MADPAEQNSERVPFEEQRTTENGVTTTALVASTPLVFPDQNRELNRSVTVDADGGVHFHELEFDANDNLTTRTLYVTSDGYATGSISRSVGNDRTENEFDLDPQLAQQFRQQILSHATDRVWTLQEIQETTPTSERLFQQGQANATTR